MPTSSKRSGEKVEAARVESRERTRLSPWVTLVAKSIRFRPDEPPEIYHCLSQPDYIAILARTRSGLIPLVRQFRPAVEEVTWELPAGLLDPGEQPEDACRRELHEETGLRAERVVRLGSLYADTGRMENRIHAFYIDTFDCDPHFEGERRLSVVFFTPREIREEITSGRFQHQLHMGVFAMAAFHDIAWDRP